MYRNSSENTKYYCDQNNNNVVRYYNGTLEFRRPDETDWRKIGPESNYYREIFLGEGNNCLVSIEKDKLEGPEIGE
jgi:hypothetical protein